MIQGTASSVGKSLLTAGLCRAYARRGLRVAPFKAQNMALNSYVTADGGEIGRAQAIQAEAAGLPPHTAMNPILLKPDAERSAQVVVSGRVLKGMSAKEYHTIKPRLREIVIDNLQQLRQNYDLVIMEGAGSAAEVNLKSQDLVNMFVATAVNSPVILVGDIDRGGIFASLLGTLDLLEPHERELVCGLVVNKFRGDPSLFDEGIRFLEERGQKPVLGVLPFLKNLRLADEDSLALEDRPRQLSRRSDHLDCAVLRYPRISNFDEFEALEHEAGVHVAYVSDPKDILDADLLILPGSKSTATDLQWLMEHNLDAAIRQRVASRKPTLGICGGYQMLGQTIHDPHGAESTIALQDGLKLAPFSTHFHPQKTVCRSIAKIQQPLFATGTAESPTSLAVEGYEIHMGQIQFAESMAGSLSRFAHISSANGESVDRIDGFIDLERNLAGTLLHGLFENETFRERIITDLWRRRGLDQRPANPILASRGQEFDRLADHLESHLDLSWLLHHSQNHGA
jgi:adenosylcobyric acid synthase